MNNRNLDLNLLRVFDAVYSAGNVSQAAAALELTQPAVSQGLARLRNLVGDPLFVRAGGGVMPTPRAQRMAQTVHEALRALEGAALDSRPFDPLHSDRRFRLHMTDIGEGQFLPRLIQSMRLHAPHARIETMRLAVPDLGPALDQGRVDLAFGFLPGLQGMRSAVMFQDRYIILMREDHPFALEPRPSPVALDDIRALEFIAVRTHAYTHTALEALHMQDRIRLTTEHFMALPVVIESSDLAVIIPRNIALSFAPSDRYAIVEADFPLREFDVSIHWSHRQDKDPAHRWLRDLVLGLYRQA
jgi:DNA-binding transcriptional LysR family regulator